MSPPWTADVDVSAELACRLIEEQFPPFRPVRAQPLGVGWDNTAYLVNGKFVFRFPRRQIAVPLLDIENRSLPVLKPNLPLPVPVPLWLGKPSAIFPWPFSGYCHLPGRTADSAMLDDAQRIQAAEPLARFLEALHGIPVNTTAHLGLGPDELRRLDRDHRAPRVYELLEWAAGERLLTDIRRYQAVVEDTPSTGVGATCVVHGDMYARQMLVDEQGRISGIIDWGDLHLGNQAIDLAVVYSFLPPAARPRFWSVYGEVDDSTRRLARFRALCHSLITLAYGHDTCNRSILQESLTALRDHILPPG